MKHSRLTKINDGGSKRLAIHRSATFLLLSAIVLVSSGCGSPGPEYSQVDGVVTLDGKPVADIEVAFLPDPDSGAVGRRSASYTDKDGHYSLRTDDGTDGAVVGRHFVLFTDTGFLPPPIGVDAKLIPPRPNRPAVPVKYKDLSRTPIKPVEVKSGEQTLNFDLVSLE